MSSTTVRHLVNCGGQSTHYSDVVDLAQVTDISSDQFHQFFVEKVAAVPTAKADGLTADGRSPSYSELSMGPFYVTQSNPAHRLADPTQPNPTQLKFKNLDPTQPNPTQWNDGAVL